jgi:pyroglutamyl-peptidase
VASACAGAYIEGMKILVTGFEPFGGDSVNPSALLVERLAAEPVAGTEIRRHVLPCAFTPLEGALREAMTDWAPDVVIGFGLATGRSGISIERVAINLVDARIPDNDGNAPIDEPVAFDGPAAYFSTLPVKGALQAVRAADIPVAVSHTAGTFVCNATFYLARHIAETMARPALVGFVHVPCLPDMPAAQDGAASLPLDRMIAAGRAVIKACLDGNTGPRISGGTIA